MSATGGHDRDAIFCFAEADNAELPGSGSDGWVDELVDCVSKDLQMRGIAQPRIQARTHGHLPAAERAMVVQRSATVVYRPNVPRRRNWPRPCLCLPTH